MTAYICGILLEAECQIEKLSDVQSAHFIAMAHTSKLDMKTI